jgi:hypothetical protein
MDPSKDGIISTAHVPEDYGSSRFQGYDSFYISFVMLVIKTLAELETTAIVVAL